MATAWIEVNGAALRYDYRKSAGRTIVLVHEMGGAIESWDAIVPALAERWSILRYDQRGAGLSEKVRQPLTIDMQADDLAALLRRLDVAGPVAVVGCALGAAVAVRFAARHASLVAELMLLSPATGLSADRRPFVLERADRIEREGVRAVLGVNDEDRRDCHENLRLTSDPSSLAATWRMLATLDLDESLAAISCPVLVAAAQHDKVRHPALVAGVARQIPNATFITLDSGHVMPVEAPELTAATLSRHLVERGF